MFRSQTNIILDSLPREIRTQFTDLGKEVKLPIREVLFSPQETPSYVYFIYDGIASITVAVQEGASAEVGLVGFEGFAGSYHLLGSAPLNTDCFMQIAGSGLRVPFDAVRRCFGESQDFRARVLEYVQRQTIILAQVAACNKLHEAEARLARWLLMVQDRTRSDMLPLTQDFLAQMLGTRRTTVAVVAGTLQKAGLIEYKRGRVRILDRERFQQAACDCYEITREALLIS